MERKYYLMASPDLLQVDYNLLADDDLNSTRYSIDGQWAIIEFKEEPQGMPFVVWTNDEAVEFLEANFWEWNTDTLNQNGEG